MREQILTLGQQAKEASRLLAKINNEQKNAALHNMARALRQNKIAIEKANAQDVELAKEKKLSAAMIDRLFLNDDRIEAMAQSIETIAALDDPIGTVLATIQRPNGLMIERVRVPIGVIGVIYESRPNVTADAAALCLKAGNTVILRGGSESFYSSTAILYALHQGLKQANLSETMVQMIPSTDRAAMDHLLTMDQFIDVIIPRGGQALISYIAEKTRIPLFKHLAGLCHTYVHQAADLNMARKIIINAKMRRTGICGATEVLLIDRTIVGSYLPSIIDDLIVAGCEIRGEQEIVSQGARVKLVGVHDYDTEFLSAVIAIKVVDDLSAAIAHITQHGTQHTDAIITQDQEAAERFLQEVDSAIVMHNTSTQFADGGEFGMGAEIGIATGKFHARGPIGVEQLTTFKYLVHGHGELREG